MVGYDPNDPMTQPEKIVAGVCTGIITKSILQPMDVIKVRSQLQKRTIRLSTITVARKIVSEEGISAFWHGYVLGQIESIVVCASQFYTYDLTTRLADMKVPSQYKYISHFFCGIVSGCIATTLVLPVEVIRIRQMLVKDQYKSIISGAQMVYRYGGIVAFYEGLSASLMLLGPQVGIQFTIFNFLQPLILKAAFSPCPPEECKSGNTHRVKDLAIASTMAGSVAGFVSKTITYPIDLVKRRLQISSHKTSTKYKTPSQSQNLIRCSSLINCLRQAYQLEGTRGLYRGWAVTVYKAQLTSIIGFTSFELICFAIREINHKN